MLDPKITELANELIQIQFRERTEQLEKDILLIQNDAAARGMGTSSALVELVYDACAREIELRAQIVWNNLMRVLSHAGVVPSPGLAEDLKQAASRYEQAIYDEPAKHSDRNARGAGFQPRRSLIDARAHAVHRIRTEIDLFVLGLQRQQEAKKTQSPANFNFYSPVGAVQTGPNAVASVVQNLGSQDREALLRALDLVKRGLDALDSLPGSPKGEIIELVTEAQSEAEREKPNGTRLQSILTAIAMAIQTVGSLQPAYQALKTALLALGIQMP